jgi:hypothetical protein
MNRSFRNAENLSISDGNAYFYIRLDAWPTYIILRDVENYGLG